MFKPFKYQYKAKVDVESTSPEVVIADKFVQPISQPQPNTKARFAAYAITLIAASGLFWTPPPAQASAGGACPETIRIRVAKSYASRVPSFFWGNFTPTAAPVAPDLSWQGEQPDIVSGKKYLIEAIDTSDGQAPIGLVPPGSNAGGVSGKSTCLVLKRRYASSAPSFFWSGFTPAAAPTFPDLSWSPEFPDLVSGKKYLTEAIDSSDGQSTTGAVFTPEVVTEDRWHQPQSQPYPYKKALTAAVDSTDGAAIGGQLPPGPTAGGVSSEVNYFIVNKYFAATSPSYFWSGFTPAAAAFPDLSWNPKYPDIVSGKKYLIEAIDTSDGQTTSGAVITPEAVTADRFVQPQSQPYPARRSLATANQLSFFWHVNIEDVSCASWLQAPQFPLQRKKAIQLTLPFVPASAEQVDSSLSQPQLRRKVQGLYESASAWSTFTPSTEVIFTNWLPTYPDKLNAKPSLHASQQQAFFWYISTAQEQVSEDKWHQPQSQPYPSRRTLLTAQQTAFFWHISSQPEDTSDEVWDFQLPQPYPYKKYPNVGPSTTWSTFTPTFPDLSWSPEYPDIVKGKQYLTEAVDSSDGQSTTGAVFTPEVVTEDRWHHTQSQPWPGKKYLASANQLSFSWGLVTPPDTLFPSHWGPTYPQPFPKKLYLQSAQQLAFFWNTSLVGETITQDKWGQPQSQPYPYRPYRPAALYPNSFWNTSTSPEQVTADKFVQPQSQPYPAKRALLTSNQLSFTWAVPSDPEVVTADRFVQPQSQPYPYRKNLAAAEQLAFFWPVPQTAEVVTADRWTQPQSQPVAKRRVQQPEAQWPPFTPAVVVPIFTNWLPSYPDRAIGRRYHASQQQAFFWNTSTQAETVSADRFAQPQSQPYSTRRILHASKQQASFWNTFTPVAQAAVLDWQQPQSQPYPAKRALRAAQQLAHVFVEQTGYNVLFPYGTGPYGVGAFEASDSWAETVTEDRWHQPQSQPYPYRKTLRAALQQTSVWNISNQTENVVSSSWYQPVTQPYPYRRYLREALQRHFIWNTTTPPAVAPDFVIGQGQVFQVIFESGSATTEISTAGSVTNVVIGRGKIG